MASMELPSILRRLALRGVRSNVTPVGRCCSRYASTGSARTQEASEDIKELESQSTFTSSLPLDEHIKTYDPIKRSQGRRRELPPSRYVARRMAWSSMLTIRIDTNTDLHDTTEDLCTLTSLRHSRTRPLENSSRGPSRTPVWSKPTRQ
jgi:hypothetical protein